MCIYIGTYISSTRRVCLPAYPYISTCSPFTLTIPTYFHHHRVSQDYLIPASHLPYTALAMASRASAACAGLLSALSTSFRALIVR